MGWVRCRPHPAGIPVAGWSLVKLIRRHLSSPVVIRTVAGYALVGYDGASAFSWGGRPRNLPS